ncbi:MAG: RNA methyltransferase [Gloeocapsa sp. DLM2.Bin57]|nr:MAG: RNA methyltransferase [Gloeocapsa sp. DLM2.Bin57]
MNNKLLNNLKIILVEPAGPLNVGSVARVMKNLGLTQLVLVKPHCNPLGAEARQMAVHAEDVLTNAQQVDDLAEALQGCQRAIATTARIRTGGLLLESPREALPWLISANLQTALIFGPEDRGLSNEELNYAQRYVYIPTNPEYPSLNLAQAVAICAYELSQLVEKVSVNDTVVREDLASLDALEGYYQQLEQLLLNIGYLYPHTASARMAKIKRLYAKAQLTKEEVTTLRGILSQINWALVYNSSQTKDKSG